MKIVLIILVMLVFVTWCSSARSGTYTTTYTAADGRVIICTTITDNYGTPISVNCIGG